MSLIAAGVSAGLGAISTGVGMVNSARDLKRSRSMLDRLGREALPEYSVDPSMQNYYNTASGMAASPQGFTGAERGRFRSGLNSTLATTRSAARNITGGGMGRALSALDVLPRINAETNFAAQDAGLARQQQNAAFGRMYQGAANMQSIRDRNAQMRIQRRLQTEQALGRAIQSNKDYMKNSFTRLGGDLITSGLMLGMNGMGGDGFTNPFRNRSGRSAVDNYMLQEQDN